MSAETPESLRDSFDITDKIVNAMTLDEELDDVLRLVRRHELDCFRVGDVAGERVLARLRDELEREEHRR